MSARQCPQCSGDRLALLGQWGAGKAYRCTACGWTWTHLPKPRRPAIKPAQRHATLAPRDLRNATKD